MSKKKKKFSFTEIIITALLSAAVTSASSVVLINHQLKEEQAYWKQRTKIERSIHKLDKQTMLYEEINAGILKSQVLARELKILASAFNVDNSIALKTYDIDRINSSKFGEKLVSFQQFAYGLVGKMHMIPVYYSDSVSSMINPVVKLIELNYTHNLNIGDRVDLDSISEYLSKNYETIPELEQGRAILVSAMNLEMNRLSEEIFKIEN